MDNAGILGKEIIFYRCKLCSYRTKSKYLLNKHINSRHFYCSCDELETYKCSYCPFVTDIKTILRKHTIENHERKEVSTDYEQIMKLLFCKICDFQTFSDVILTKHTVIEHHDFDGWFKCDKCTFKTALRPQLIHHQDKSHENYKARNCSYCSMQFISRKKFRNHIKSIHEGAFEFQWYHCGMCNYKDKNYSNVHKHRLAINHDKVQEWKCTECSYTTQEQGEYNKHVKLYHLNKKIFNCAQCSFTTTVWRVLKKHMYSKHKIQKGNTRMFKCKFCPAQISPDSMTEHMLLEHI